MKLLDFAMRSKNIGTFLAVGGFIYLLDIFLIWIFVKKMGLHIIIAVSLAYVIVVVIRFILDRNITFKKTSNSNKFNTFICYIAVVIVNYVLTIVIVDVSLAFITSEIIIAKTIAVALTFFVGYFGMKYWVFKIK